MISDELSAYIGRSNIVALDVMEILDRTSRFWINGDRSIVDDAEIVVRLLDRADEFENLLSGSRKVIDALAREAGLFPYITTELSIRDEMAIEVHRVPGIDNMIFHGEQRQIFSKLENGKNIVLSAPTSFGKTLLVDALIASKKPKLVIIAVPTIALLEERRRTLKKRFPKYRIVSQHFQQIPDTPTIIVGTQERILERQETLIPDLFVIDEFYKLDLTKGDTRAKSLNVLLAQYIDVAKQVYLLGPNIEADPLNSEERSEFEFVKTSFSPVTADIIKVSPTGTDPETLFEQLRFEISGSSLVYCRSPKSTRDLARELLERGFDKPSPVLSRISNWLKENYHEKWYVADALAQGIGIHHGRVPRAIAHLMVRLFNEGIIEVLICTSSLIEGVNTAAKNVIIYDKYISRSKLDRFTYDNIKGRAGRMFQHFVGKIYLFNDAPEPYYEELDIPLLKSKGKISDEALLQIPDIQLSEENRIKKTRLLERTEVSEYILRRYAKFGIQNIEKIHLELEELLYAGDKSLLWSGLGTYQELLDSMETVWGRIEFDKHGVRSAKQFALFANWLTRASNIKAFLKAVTKNDQSDESIDLGFNFLKGAEFSFVEPLGLLQDLINSFFKDANGCDYSKFISDMSSWGLPENTKALEEIGVPTPIIQRVAHIVNQYDIDEAVVDIKRLMKDGEILSQTDIEILSFTIADS